VEDLTVFKVRHLDLENDCMMKAIPKSKKYSLEIAMWLNVIESSLEPVICPVLCFSLNLFKAKANPKKD
jgi:hypothetical protein